MLGFGDVVASRLLYQRAAEAGDADAALKLAQTYDADFLGKHKLIGVTPDPAAASEWYRIAKGMNGVKPADSATVATTDDPHP